MFELSLTPSYATIQTSQDMADIFSKIHRSICKGDLYRLMRSIHLYFSSSLTFHEPKTKKISCIDDVWKSEEEITKTKLNFTSIFLRNTGQFENYVQTLVSRTSSDLKTPRSLLKMLDFASQFQLFSVFGNRRTILVFELFIT